MKTKPKKLIRIKSVECLGGYRVRIGLTDQSERDIDLEPYLTGPMFEALLADKALFAQVFVDPELRTLVWPNGADIDPDVLVHGIPADKLDQIPPFVKSGQ